MLGTREYYDKTAAEWAENGYGDGEYLPCLDEFLSLLPPGGRVLDLCCGAGYETGRIRARGFEALGLDFSGGSLRIAREAAVVRPGGYVLASIREGRGRLEEWSLREIDGERYDRNFIAHTPDEVMGAARRWFSYCRELASDRPIWRQLLFRREGGCP